MRRLAFILVLLLTVCCLCACGSDETGGDNQSVQSGGNTSGEEQSPQAELSWWSENERYSAFLKYDGHGTEKQEAPVQMSDSTAEGYILYGVPRQDYISYWHKLEDSGLELYDYNFGLLDRSEIVKSAEGGYAVFIKDKYMMELSYSDFSKELIFQVYLREDGGE